MRRLYLLCEDNLDEWLYEHLAERVTGQSFELGVEGPRLRPNPGWKGALAGARLLLNWIKRWHGQQDVAVILAVDNDRAPGHPGAPSVPLRPLPNADRRKEPRHAKLTEMVHAALGPRREDWPVTLAIAVPVEMIESWALHLHDPHRPEPLPIFSEAIQPGARAYHGGTAPPQLKNLVKAEAATLGISRDEYFARAAGDGDLEAAGAVSPSLAMFVSELHTWRESAR